MKKYLKEDLALGNFFKWLKYKFNFNKIHPGYFWDTGIIAFAGPQGSGKTLSMVRCCCRLMERYPDLVVVSNMILNDVPDGITVIQYSGLRDFLERDNGERGIVFLWDEGQIEFNSLESKEIPIEMIGELCQNRKTRRLIMITTQVFTRLAKPLREQITYLVQCRCILGCLQINSYCKAIDCFEDSSGKLVCNNAQNFIWFHDPAYYAKYDTLAKISRMKDEFYQKEKKGGTNYGRRF